MLIANAKSSTTHHFVERRSTRDRRHQQFQAFCWQFFKARRVRERRRNHCGTHQYVDVHGAELLLTILAILMLCILDAYFTLILLNNGAVEVNPVMRVLIYSGGMSFFVTKYLLTASALIVLLVHKDFVLIAGLSCRHIMFAALAGYFLLIGYEISLLRQIGFSF